MRGIRDAAGMVICQDDRGGVMCEDALDDFAGVRPGTIDGASEQLLECDDSMAGIEIHSHRQWRAIRQPHRLFGLSKLSVWWLRLGIGIERIQPGNPQQNGRHERMHLTLKKEAMRPAGRNFLQQQAKFDRFMHEYNFERSHQALGMKYPAELYSAARRLGPIKV